jgi:outer membrane protein OmpA-like peptidoglycan-associated protein
MLGGAMVAWLGLTSGALAAGSSIDGVRGLLRVHSADTGVPGYVAGSLYGAYAREFYSGPLSPRGRREEVKFGAGMFSLGFTPNRYVELGVRGTVESQFVSALAFDDSDSQIGLGQVATTTGDQNALVGTWDSDGMDLGGRLNLTYSYLQRNDDPNLRMHLNAGYLNRTGEFDAAAYAASSPGGTVERSTLHGDQFLYGAALEFPVPRNWTFFTEWTGEYDLESEAPFDDNPMRITPGLRWSTGSSSFIWTTGYEVGLGSDESGPGWQVVSGISFGGYVAPVTGSLTGVVRDADTGEVLSNVAVAVRNSGETPASTDAQGRFAMEAEQGYAVVELNAEGYNPKTRVVEVPGHQAMDIEFTMTKRNIYGSVRGRVRDTATGTPLFGRVRVAGTSTWAETDPASGTFFLEQVPEGDVQLEIEAKNYATASVGARIAAGEITAQDVSLARDLKSMMGVLTGAVHDGQSGRAIAASVTARGKTTKTVPVDPVTGLYELELEAGVYSISATSPGYVASVESIEVAEKDASVHNFDLRVLPKKMALKGVFFDSGAATIKRESLVSLEEAGDFLKDNPSVYVVIEGHTDSSGSVDQNLSLSQRRADAVLKFLVVNYGIPVDRLQSKGFGPNQPIANNQTEEGRALNRRIEFEIQEKPQKN